MKYAMLTFDGAVFPIANQLLQEGNEVIVGQVEDGKELGITGNWITDKEPPEVRRRRLSLYDGIIQKLPLEAFLKRLKGMDREDTFYFPDYNIFYNIDQQIQAMGFTKGHFHTVEDFLREKDRATARAFLKQHYTVMEPSETKQFGAGQVEQAELFPQTSWAGNRSLPDSRHDPLVLIPFPSLLRYGPLAL